MLLGFLNIKSLKIHHLPEYHEFIFEPTETTHGGTGFYIKDNIDLCHMGGFAN